MKSDFSLSRRSFLRTAAVTAGAVGLAACAPKAEPTKAPVAEATKAPTAAPAPVERVELEVWTGWTEQAAKNIEMILGGYNDSQESVTAKHVVIPDNMTQRLLAGISAGNPPGTAVVFGANIAYQLAAQNGLLALDEVGEAELPEDLRRLSAEERQEKLAALAAEREEIDGRLRELAKKRDAFLRAKAPEDGFDARVLDSLKDQAEEVGVSYE